MTLSTVLNQIEKYAEHPRKEGIEEFRSNMRHLIEMIVWSEKTGEDYFQ